eukprot:Skav232702  [mRNA]  locus=scaffold3459:21932:22830:- [translate_table: standard]
MIVCSPQFFIVLFIALLGPRSILAIRGDDIGRDSHVQLAEDPKKEDPVEPVQDMSETIQGYREHQGAHPPVTSVHQELEGYLEEAFATELEESQA